MGLFLAKNGVPFDVAFSLDDDDLLVWAVIHARFEGQEFDFDTMTFRPIKK